MTQTSPALNNKADIRKKSFKTNKGRLSNEEMEIVRNLEALKLELDETHANLDYITDPILIDSCIYEILSINMRYKYYIKLCKEKGLIADGFGR